MLYGIAYRMLGSFSDAEDAVQDAWFRWQDANLSIIESPRAYLASTVSRLCIDRHRRRKLERMLYTGPWLPEPVDDAILEQINEPEADLELVESVSMAFLLLLQKLPPMERAVFILKESFDLGHVEIAAMLNVRPAHSRQLLRRARQKVNSDKLDLQMDEDIKPLMESFLEAATTGNLSELQNLMTDDIVAYSDGGGRASAALIPLEGKDRVSTVLLHLLSRQLEPLKAEWRRLNGNISLVLREGNSVHSTHAVSVRDGKIHRIYTMRNPDKLHYVE